MVQKRNWLAMVQKRKLEAYATYWILYHGLGKRRREPIYRLKNRSKLSNLRCRRVLIAYELHLNPMSDTIFIGIPGFVKAREFERIVMDAHIVTEELIITREQASTAGPITTGPIAAAHSRLDWFGILCSFGCALHCAAMPALLAILPSLTSLRWLADPLFHQIVAVLCGVLVAQAIVPCYRKHRDSRVVTLAGVGIGLLFIAAFILPDTCCSDTGQLHTGQLHTGSELTQRRHKIVLVSSTSLVSSNASLGSFKDEQLADRGITCESGNCTHVVTFSRPLLTAVELEGQLGKTVAQRLIQAQPYLSPIGGLFLIFAHIMNIRLRCCRRAPCRK